MSKRSKSKKRRPAGADHSRPPQAPRPPIRPIADSRTWPFWLSGGLIALATIVVYWNTLDNAFVTWDDRDYIYENPLLTRGLGAIWTDAFAEKPHEQYYPIVFSSFWVEYQFVKLDPWLYHATQMALHAINAVLLLFVLRQLGLGLFPAVVASALFALHPVNVASVAWVTERKNTLSALFMLIAMLLYIRHRRRSSRLQYVGAVFAYVLGLLAKTAIVTLAPILIMTDWVLDRRFTWASLKRCVPFFVIGLIMAAVTMKLEGRRPTSGSTVAPIVRPFIAAAAVTHYVSKLAVPVNLLPVYPRWPDDPKTFLLHPRYGLSVVAIILAGFLIWKYRKSLGAYVHWGLAVFLLAVSPMLGLKHFNYMTTSFVSDHFLYHSAPGLFVVVGIFLDRLRGKARPRAIRNVGEPTHGTEASRFVIRNVAVGGFILAALTACGWLTIKQNRVWKNGVTFWEYVLQGNPNEFGGYNNLGNHYYRNKDFERALEYYRGALQTPDGKTHVWSRRNCARCCRKLGRPDEAIQYYAEAIQVATDTNRRAIKEHTEYADYLKRQGRHSRALAEFKAILRKRPNNSHAKKMIREIRERIGAVEGSSDRATHSFSRASRSIRVSKPRSKSC